MISYLLLKSIIVIVGLVFAFSPVITELPWEIDSFFLTGITGFNYLAEFFPPLRLFMTLTLIYLGFKVSMLVMKFFLGTHTPTTHV